MPPSSPTSAIEPFVPEPFDCLAKALQRLRVACYPVIGKVPMQLLHQLVPLLPDWQMQMALHPLVDRFEAPAHPLGGCLAFHCIPSFASLPPVMGKAKKVECARFLVPLSSCCLPAPSRGGQMESVGFWSDVGSGRISQSVLAGPRRPSAHLPRTQSP